MEVKTSLGPGARSQSGSLLACVGCPPPLAGRPGLCSPHAPHPGPHTGHGASTCRLNVALDPSPLILLLRLGPLPPAQGVAAPLGCYELPDAQT